MSWIQLNVGGVMMETTLSTVTKYPDSALARMFHNHNEGVVYNIDCNPEYFKVILEWLRYIKLPHAAQYILCSTSLK